MNPLLSIVVPTYNAEQIIGQCITSITRQTFDDFEIVIQDALSKDRTQPVVQELRKIYPNITINFFSERDSGIYDGMNKGIKNARGKWILFLGSDDKLYSDDALKKVFTNADYEDYEILYGNVYSSRFNGIYDGPFDEKKILKKNICHQSIFFKKSVFRKIGFFNTEYKVYADWDHNWRWFFSKRIRRKYVDIIVADYADGGYSSENNRDDKFVRQMNLNLIKYAHNSLSLETKLKMFKEDLYPKRKSGDWRGVLRSLSYIPYVLFRF